MENKIKEPYDVVDNHFRCEIDRSESLLLRHMLDKNGNPILLSIILEKLRANKLVALLDAGCGTGRTLFEIVKQVKFRAGSEDCHIRAIGVNDQDYSQESEINNVITAIQEGQLCYIQDRLEKVNLPSFIDVIWSYEVLIHNPPDIAKDIVYNLLKFLNKDGWLFFNLTVEQWESSEISALLTYLCLKNYSVDEYTIIMNNDTRVFIAIHKK